MTTKDEALKLALEALENSIDLVSNEARKAEKMYANVPTRLARVQGLVAYEAAHEKAITAIKEALAAPVQEPVNLDAASCFTFTDERGAFIGDVQMLKWLVEHHSKDYWVHMAYPALKPLTDEELYEVFPAIATYTEANKTLYRSIARAIEAAHGIKGDA